MRSAMAQSARKQRVDPSSSACTEFLTGVRETAPLIVGAVPFGIIFGTLAGTTGLSLMSILAMSALVFAASAQFIAVGLVLAVGMNWPLIVLITLVVNLRHIFYGATLAPHLRFLPLRWQVPLAFWLTDETFAVVINRLNRTGDPLHLHWHYLGSAIFAYVSWQVLTVLGVTVGQLVPGVVSWGLDFAMPVTFIGLLIPHLKNSPMVATALVSGGVVLLAAPMPHKLGLLVATLAGIGAGIVVETLFARKAD